MTYEGRLRENFLTGGVWRDSLIYAILSREHMVYNLSAAEAMRNWVVISVEKNRAGRNAVDMEFALDAAHFRMVASGDFVRERLVDEKVVLA